MASRRSIGTQGPPRLALVGMGAGGIPECCAPLKPVRWTHRTGTPLLLAVLLTGCGTIDDSAEKALASAADKATILGQTLIRQAGEEARVTITHAAEELEAKGRILVDHAADRAEAVVDRVPEATQRAAKQTESLLDSIQDWWLTFLGGTLTLLLAAYALWQRRKSLSHQRAVEVVTQAVEGMGEAGTAVKKAVAKKLATTRDGYRIRESIWRAKGDGHG